jgi:hypothetical protein
MIGRRPIIFSAPMVLALLAGRKTQTRRLLKVPGLVASEPDDRMEPGERWDYTSIGQREEDGVWRAWMTEYPEEGSVTVYPPARVGDRLWVRETWRAWERKKDGLDHVLYRADDQRRPIPNTREAGDFVVGKFERWQSPRFMPRWASRIELEVSAVRAQRLQAISEDDARAEGFRALTKDGGQTIKHGIPDRDGLPGNDDFGWHWHEWQVDPRKAYATLWNRINGKRASWESNPWVWALTFTPRLLRTVPAPGAASLEVRS